MISALFSLPMNDAAGPADAAGSFVVGPENGLVRQLAQEVTGERLPHNPLVLYGASGVGKSTLAHLLADRRIKALSLAHPLKTTAADLARALAHAAETSSVAELRTRHQRCDLLLIDDLHQLAGKSAAQQFLLTTIDVLVRRGVLVLATLRQLPQSTDGLLAAFASRLNAGLAVPLVPPEELARGQIVRQLAERLDLRLTDEMLAGLANPPGRRGAVLTAPRLRSTLLALASAADHGRRSLGSGLVSEVLESDRAQEKAGDKAIVRQITAVVAKHYGLTVADLKGPSRQQTTAEARSVAMYLARELSDFTLAGIGKLFGNRDHSTVLHACRKITSLVRQDTSIGRVVRELKSQIAGQTA